VPASTPPVATRLAFHPSRVVISAGVLITLGSMSLPYAAGRSSLDVGALPALFLVLPIFAFTLVPDHARPLPRPLALVSAVLAAVAVPFALVTLLDAVVLSGTLGGSIGSGAVLLVGGTLVIASGVAMGLLRPNALVSLAGRRLPVSPAAPGTAAAIGETGLDSKGVSIEESPFEGPLFDSLEIPAFVAGEPDTEVAPERSGDERSEEGAPPGDTGPSPAVSAPLSSRAVPEGDDEIRGTADDATDPTLVFEAESAAGRSADDAGDRIRGG
jgi:hypothetical protein